MSIPVSAPTKGLRIGVRLGLSFGAVIALMLCIVGVALVSMTSLSSTTSNIIEHEWEKMDAASTLSAIATLNARRTVQQLVSNEDERRALRQEIVAGRERFVNAFDSLKRSVKRPEAVHLLDQAEQARTAYVAS